MLTFARIRAVSLLSRINWRFIAGRVIVGVTAYVWLMIAGAAFAITVVWAYDAGELTQLLAPLQPEQLRAPAVSLASLLGGRAVAPIAASVMAAWTGAEILASAFGRWAAEWRPSEIDTLRQLASVGWIVVPDDGDYIAYGPNHEQQRLDHWHEVEELCTRLASS